MIITFFAPGIPRPKGSKRMVRLRNGRTVLIEDSKAEGPWRTSVSGAAHAAMHQGRERFEARPLGLLLEFIFPRPKSHFTSKGLRPTAPRFHTGKPDCSKLVRSVEDALNGIVWDDDSRVAVLIASKVYASEGESPGVHVRVNLAAKEERAQPQLTLLNGGI